MGMVERGQYARSLVSAPAFSAQRVPDGSVTQVRLGTDFSQGQSGSAQSFDFSNDVRGELEASCVSHLLVRCGPLTVPGRIRSVIVSPVNRSAGWTRAHIGQEIVEVQPARIDGDTSAAVVRVLGTSRVGGSMDHASPAVERRCVRQPVSGVAGYCDLAFQTAAAFRVAVAEQSSSNCHLGPAITSAEPASGSVCSVNARFRSNRCKAAEALSGYVRCSSPSHTSPVAQGWD